MKKNHIILIILLQIVGISTAYSQVGLGKYFKPNASQSQDIDYANPKKYEIAEIKVNGVEFLDHNALISLSGLKIGDRIQIPGDAISSAIKKLWQQGIIGDISIEIEKIEGDKIFLIIA